MKNEKSKRVSPPPPPPLFSLDLAHNDEQILATLEILIEGCPRLREARLPKGGTRRRLGTPESWEHLKAFKAKLLAETNKKIT